ncbi:MAG: DUF4130 domain-containing protein [Hymenobacter sp.]
MAATVLDEREPLFQVLWQAYFDHVNIPERRNLKLHRRHMPLRYWKYLSEKQPRAQLFQPINNKQPAEPGARAAGRRSKARAPAYLCDRRRRRAAALYPHLVHISTYLHVY